jgi:mannose-6-phosphate isomerase-like protein (cupin superfamily)
VNIKEQVEDRAPQFGLAPNLEGRFATVPLGLEKSGVSYQRFAPNFRLPFGHKQTEQEELYVVVSGSGRIKLDDEIVELNAWDGVRVAPEVMRCIEAGREGVEILAFGAPYAGPSPGDDAEVTQNWWAA